VHNVQFLHILDSLDELPHDDARFSLLERASLLEEAAQVEAVRILLNHVDLFRRLDRLDVPHTIVAMHHAIDFDLLED